MSKNDAQGNRIDGGNLPHLAHYDYDSVMRSSRAVRMGLAVDPTFARLHLDAGYVNYDKFVGYFFCPNGGLIVRARGCRLCAIM